MSSFISPAGRLTCEPPLAEPDWHDEPDCDDNLKPCPECPDDERIAVDAKRCHRCESTLVAECGCDSYHCAAPETLQVIRACSVLVTKTLLAASGSRYAAKADVCEIRRCRDCRELLTLYLGYGGESLTIVEVRV